jgi:hypothetical protein
MERGFYMRKDTIKFFRALRDIEYAIKEVAKNPFFGAALDLVCKRWHAKTSSAEFLLVNEYEKWLTEGNEVQIPESPSIDVERDKRIQYRLDNLKEIHAILDDAVNQILEKEKDRWNTVQIDRPFEFKYGV